MTTFGNNIESRLIDIGYGKPAELSSVWGSSENSRQLFPASFGFQSDFAFHTDYQDRPSILVDLLSIRPVKRIRVFNRDAVPERAIPLVISMSNDKDNWTELARINYVFGGRATGEPLDLIFRDQRKIRYLKFFADAETILHFEYIEILALLPVLSDGRLQKIDVSGPSLLAEYCHHSSYGFTWTFTATIQAISECRRWDVTVSNVDYSCCLAPFKNAPGVDLYPVMFLQQPVSERHTSLLPVKFEHHGVYASFDLSMLHEYAFLYFSPSLAVLSFQQALTTRYRLQPQNAIALIYRGTDKWSEVVPTPIENYIRVALDARRQSPGIQVIIQTDQRQALDAVVAAIPDAIYFEELPVSNGATAIHQLPLEEEFKVDKLTFAIRMLAVVHLLAQFRYVVTHTGNIGFWLACYRGRADGFYQFDTETRLRGPSGTVLEDFLETEVF